MERTKRIFQSNEGSQETNDARTLIWPTPFRPVWRQVSQQILGANYLNFTSFSVGVAWYQEASIWCSTQPWQYKVPKVAFPFSISKQRLLRVSVIVCLCTHETTYPNNLFIHFPEKNRQHNLMYSDTISDNVLLHSNHILSTAALISPAQTRD